jgi:S-adenosylmethionine decarboxylase
MLFEGPEKKLEILAAPDMPPLRSLGTGFWQRIVERARAKIISTASGATCDAHLLSESSLFVWDRRMLMITCGRTTLVESAMDMLDRIPRERLASLIYERKNENFPELQQTTFDQDVERIQSRVPGTRVIFGDPEADHISLFHLDNAFEPDPADATLEVLMYDMEPRASRLFSMSMNERDIRRSMEFDEMFPAFQIDDHLFDPMGYSFNAIKDDFYATLHVTPQRKGSYTSFETNYRVETSGVRATVSHLLGFFRPARCDVLVFQSGLDLGGLENGFRVASTQAVTLGCGYACSYAHIDREFVRRPGSSKE